MTTDGAQRMKVDFFGAFAWRDAAHLYYMPYRESAPANEVWVFNVLKQTSVRLTDPALTPFKMMLIMIRDAGTKRQRAGKEESHDRR